VTSPQPAVDRPAAVTIAAVLVFIMAGATALGAVGCGILALASIAVQFSGVKIGALLVGLLLAGGAVALVSLTMYQVRLGRELLEVNRAAYNEAATLQWIYIAFAVIAAILRSLAFGVIGLTSLAWIPYPALIIILLRTHKSAFKTAAEEMFGAQQVRAGRKQIIASSPPAAESGTKLLVVEDVRTHFLTPAGAVKAVDGVSFDLDRGRTLGVVGESGSGKTILSRSIMGLLPTHNVIRKGSIRYSGHEISGFNPDQMASVWGTEMAMIFQDPMTSLNPVMKVGRQITESLMYHLDMEPREAGETAIALLTSVGIPEPGQRINEYPHQLSGGMRQRVMIAVALACGPRLLFADEPTTALDVTVQAQILDLLQTQQRERHMAMILVTHDLGVVAGRTDEIAVMYAGKVVEKAPTSVLFSDMKMPYTEALLKSIPKLEDASHTKLEIIAGRPPDLINPPEGCNFSPRCPYAQPRCFEEEPPLRPTDDPDHLFACWYPVGTPEGQEALEVNLKAGREETIVAVATGAGEQVGN
jgi:peptide/nickel transport system ATP-binding protein